MKIESIDRQVEELLKTGYFIVPRFQRPYCWERAEVEDFWNDTIAEAESDYFIGSIVLFKKSEGAFGIVDGQQRLTNAVIFLRRKRTKRFGNSNGRQLSQGHWSSFDGQRRK